MTTGVRRRRAVAGLVGLALVLLMPAIALAHPLGNFTINHYAGIRLEPGRAIVDAVVDQAEIPTFQEKLRIDTDGDGSVSDDEAEAERLTACPILARSLTLTAGGTALPLVPVAAGLSFPPGAAGLETMRLVCTYTAAVPQPLAAGTAFTFRDVSHAERLGWREIAVSGSGIRVTGSDLPTITRSDRLSHYPQDLLSQPLNVRSAAFTAAPGGAILAPFSVPDATPLPGAAALYPSIGGDSALTAGASPQAQAVSGMGSAAAAGTVAAAGSGPALTTAAAAATGASTAIGAVPGGVGSEVSSLLRTRDLTPFVLIGSLLAAMALGAGHALTPGHGKTLMGAYLVGTRGTAVHAVALGLSVTVSHTLGILVLAAIVIALRDVVSPEAFNRFAPLASGLMVIAIGGWLLASQIRVRRATRAMARSTGHAHVHDDGHAHDHDHADHHHDHETHAHVDAGANGSTAAQTHADADADPDPGMHSHGGISHSHLPAAGTSVSWRSLFVLGLAGGIIPSTNALIILLSTIATGRAAYGLILVVAFGLGMAVILGGVGLGLVFARGRMDGLPTSSGLGRIATYAPVMAGVLVFSLGIYLTTQAVGVAPNL